jgi:hypothetical protein
VRPTLLAVPEGKRHHVLAVLGELVGRTADKGFDDLTPGRSQPDLVGLSAEIVSGTVSGRVNAGLVQASVIVPTFSAALSTRGDS